jgi:hypothetical protein
VPLRKGAGLVAASRQRLHHAGQFGAQGCKRGGVRRALRADHEIDRGEGTEQVAAQDLTQAPAQPIAGDGGRLVPRNDEPETGVARCIVTPDQIEVLGPAPATGVPAGRELRAARDPSAARKPLARLPAPVFGWNTDDETLAALLAPARQRRATPNGFHPRAKSMFIDASPISRPICRTHKFLV